MKFQTGTGPTIELDVDSALDIGSCKVDGVEISPGTAVPDDGDPRILHAVGGFLFTCGPDHIRHPEPIEGGSGKFPLHGSLSGNKATAVDENLARDCHEVRAIIPVTLAQGGTAELHRLWRMHSATGEVMLEDSLINTGTSPFAPMLMYHMNIGAHLFDDNTMVRGAMIAGDETQWTFGEGDGCVFCVPAEAEPGDEFARVVLGPISGIGGKSLHVRFSTDTIPHLQMWRNQKVPAHVLGIEPASHPWKTRADLAELGLMAMLAPGEAIVYKLSFSFQ